MGDKDPDRSGSVGAAIHRAWIDLKARLGGRDKAILSSVEAGEDAAKHSYEKALEDSQLPEYLADLVRRQLAAVASAHDHVRSLRDTRAA